MAAQDLDEIAHGVAAVQAAVPGPFPKTALILGSQVEVEAFRVDCP